MTEREKIIEQSWEELSYILAATDDKELIKNFLLELLSKHEAKEISDRWTVVRMLDQGISQRKIAENLEMSLCKITRGSKEYKKENSAFRRMIELYKKNATL
ncbi:MAG: trp operon repressor [Spirochaetia bacterium]|nr:trp operon repressor [Spirochaetia bacterium]